MKIQVFGNLNDIITKAPAPEYPLSLADLKEYLYGEYPEIRRYPMKVAIDRRIIEDDTVLITENSEVALLPPFSGG